MAADEEENYVVAQANTPINADGSIRRPAHARAPVAAGRQPRRPPQDARSRELLRRHHRHRLRAAGRGRLHRRLAEADRLGRHGAHPVPRARRRQPRPDGREHAEAGRPAAPCRGAVHRHRHRGPCRPRRRRPDPGHRRRRGHRGHRRAAITVQYKTEGKQVYRLAKFRRVEPGHVHQPASPRRRGRQGRQGPRSSPTARRPITASSPSARTCSSRSCRGRATTSRTRSSCPSAW